MNKKFLVCIVGPTAIGKTALSLRLAQHFQTEILSGDSRQFYKEMRIGTAVPSEEELQVAKHHFIQNRSIREDYSVGAFEQDAIALLQELFRTRDVLLMVGGSGLYVDAVCRGLDEFPEVDPDIRKGLQMDLKRKGITFLQEKLKALDPDSYRQLDMQNKQRLIRALEVCLGSGRPYSSFLSNPKKKRDFSVIKIGLTAEREVIYGRINARVDQMMAQGLLEEVKALYPFRERNALQTVGYRELFEFLDGKRSLQEAVEEVKKNTRRFAKRQATWYRKDPEIRWFDHNEDQEGIIRFLENTMRSTNSPSGS